MKKIIVSMLLVVLLLTGCASNAKLADGKEKVVGLSEGDITADDLYQEIKNKYGLNVLINMIDTKILDKKYKEDDEEKKYIENMKAQTEMYYKYIYAQQYSSYNQFLLAQYGVSSADELDPVFRLDHRRNKIVKEYAKTLVSDKDIQSYYDTKIVGDMKVSHILIPVDSESDDETAKQEAKDKAYQTAQELIKKLDDGEDFAKLAKENSKDSSASNGGDIGYFNDGDNEEAFFEASKKLKVGEYTKTPVETKYGYHIIKLTDKKEKAKLEDVKDKIVDKLAEEKQTSDDKMSYKALIKMREDSKIDISDKDLKKQYENYLYNYGG
jgi:foldase protein PrsA